MGYLASIIILLAAALGSFSGTYQPAATDPTVGSGISQLDQFKATSTPYNAITTQTHAKDIYAPYSDATTTSLAANIVCLIGDSCRSTWPTGGGGGSGSVGTSTADTASQVTFFTTNNATPALIGGDAGLTYSSSADRLTVTFASTTALSSGYASSTNAHIGTLTLTTALTDANVSDTLTVGASGSVNDSALSANVSLLGQSISASEIANGDHGDFTYTGGSAALDADTVADSEIDYANVTLGDFTNDANYAKTNTFQTFSIHQIFSSLFATVASTSAATSTTFYATNFASTSKFHADGLATCTGNNYLTWTGGVFGCDVDDTSAGAADPFTFLSNYAAINAATSSPIWAQNGLNASSTSHLFNADFTNATTTSLYIGSLTGPLQAIGGLVSASSTLNDAYISDALTISGSGSVADAALSANVSLLGQTIGATELASADFGDFTCNGTTCSFDADTVNESEIDLTAVTLADFTNDANYAKTNLFQTFSLHQIFSSLFATNASSTNATTTSLYVGTHQYKNFGEVSFTYGSSTQGMGTTTIPKVKVMPGAGQFTSATCHSNSFMRVLMQDEAGNRANDFISSSTEGTVALTTNNTFTENEPILFYVGTTTNIASNVYVGCTYKYVYN